MRTLRTCRAWPTVAAGLAIVGMCAALVAGPASALGQGRGPGDRSRGPGGDGGDRGDRREQSSPRREESAPRRQDPPPSRQEFRVPPRTYEPPARIEPRRDGPPPRIELRRNDPPARIEPRRDGPPPRIELRRDDPPVRTDRSRDTLPWWSRDRANQDGRQTRPNPWANDRPADRDRGSIDRGSIDRGRLGGGPAPSDTGRDGGSRYDRFRGQRPDDNARRFTGGDPGSPGDRTRGGGSGGPGDRTRTDDSRGSGGVRDGRGPSRDSGGNGPVRRGDGSGDRIDRRNGGDRGIGVGGLRSDPRPGPSRIDNGGRAYDPSPQRQDARRIFSRSREGRSFDNGVVLRAGSYVSHPRLRPFFGDYYSYYPYYYPTYNAALCYYSPYSFYFGVCAPYIYRSHAWYYPPSVVYIETPVYVGDDCRGYNGDLDDYYLDRGAGYYDSYDARDRTLDRAVDDIRSAFTDGDIERLVYLTDPQVRIAIYLRGRYDYSVSADDYLDMTRDAMRNMDTVSFDLYRIRRRSSDVYVASGRHVYRDQDGDRRTVYVSFVLERVRDRWTITQVGTAPDRIREP